jgi:hypothetical protein
MDTLNKGKADDGGKEFVEWLRSRVLTPCMSKKLETKGMDSELVQGIFEHLQNS